MQTTGKLLSRLEFLGSCRKVILKHVYAACSTLNHTVVSVGIHRNRGMLLFCLVSYNSLKSWYSVLSLLCVSVGVHW